MKGWEEKRIEREGKPAIMSDKFGGCGRNGKGRCEVHQLASRPNYCPVSHFRSFPKRIITRSGSGQGGERKVLRRDEHVLGLGAPLGPCP
ncbi:hypothetical protein E2C01_002582 [Portunus trituberculatus]|uniref:Uncharacterized protein n=1 Tax=Portunus trituberculatus TaxID=210409 RepID=A0A5B7CME4_PORTR|nr:hypothetical protein [Portunus trituberculatus]